LTPTSFAIAQLSPVEEGEALFGKGKYEQAAQKFTEVAKNPFAAPADVALSMCRLGVIKSIGGNQTAARKDLEESIGGNALPSRHSAVCYYALLQILVIEREYSGARDLLRRMGDLNLAPLYQARAWALGAEVGAKLEDSRLEVVYLQKLLNVMERNSLADIEVKILNGRKIGLAEVRKRLGVESGPKPPAQKPTPVAQETPVAAASALSQSPSNATPTPKGAKSVQLQFSPRSGGVDSAITGVMREIAVGNVASALNALGGVGDLRQQQTLLEEIGIGVSPDRVASRLARLQSDDPRSLRVGVVLPVGEFYTKFNSRILRSISAFAASSAVNGVTISFAVKAVNPDVGSAETAAVELALDDHVHVIVGPVSNSQTLGVMSVAHLFAVPVFALGPVVAAPEYASPFLVRMGVSARSQAELAVRQLVEELKDKPVAVLAPNDPYGYEVSMAFSHAAKEKGIPVSISRFFSASAQVLRADVEAMIGPQPTKESRKEEYETLLEEAKKKAQAEKRRFDPKSVLLPPILPFEALFLPESLARARVIASTFAFFGAEKVRFFGDKQWSEGANGRSSIADPFMNGARVMTPVSGPFLPFLKRELASNEGYLDLERQAFDALCFARNAQYRAKGNNGALMAQAMRGADWQVEGTTNYGVVDASGEPATKFAVLGFKNGKLEVALPSWQERPSK
jgi:hypothetical protein